MRPGNTIIPRMRKNSQALSYDYRWNAVEPTASSWTVQKSSDLAFTDRMIPRLGPREIRIIMKN